MIRALPLLMACAVLAGCQGGDGEQRTAPESALARAQAEADAGRAALARARAEGIVAARAYAAAHGVAKAAVRPGVSFLGEPDEEGFVDLDWSRMVPPEDIALLRDAPPVLHVGNRRTKQTGTLHTVAALAGRKVKLSGYVVPLESDDDGKMVEFFFVPFYGACIHVPPPPPNMLVHVRLAHGVVTPSLYDPLTLKGVLHTEVTRNAMASSAYAMSDAVIEPYHDDDAKRLREAFE
ncbi:DUF3299 domain-containing protein [Luteibacter sp. CQ10]|uniref:DUF3299 domain-containing protein n=1 Tax=Luteibacter sp. CQ10 TaxID=2805821 RepID=UPI0034A5C5BB